MENPKYIEYRQGFMGVTSEIMANKTLQNGNQREHFVKSISTSKDLKALLVDNEIINKLDELSGPLKIVLTLISKWYESKMLSA